MDATAGGPFSFDQCPERVLESQAQAVQEGGLESRWVSSPASVNAVNVLFIHGVCVCVSKDPCPTPALPPPRHRPTQSHAPYTSQACSSWGSIAMAADSGSPPVLPMVLGPVSSPRRLMPTWGAQSQVRLWERGLGQLMPLPARGWGGSLWHSTTTIQHSRIVIRIATPSSRMMMVMMAKLGHPPPPQAPPPHGCAIRPWYPWEGL